MALLRPRIARPATATSLGTFSQADPANNWYRDPSTLFPGKSPYSSITHIEGERPWSHPATTWDNLTASRGSITTLRTNDTARHELTMPEHYPNFSRRGRGPPTFAYGLSHSSSLGSLQSLPTPLESSLSTLSCAPSHRSLRLEERHQQYRQGMMRPGSAHRSPSLAKLLERPKTATLSSKTAEVWKDKRVAGIGYASKFYYRD